MLLNKNETFSKLFSCRKECQMCPFPAIVGFLNFFFSLLYNRALKLPVSQALANISYLCPNSLLKAAPKLSFNWNRKHMRNGLLICVSCMSFLGLLVWKTLVRDLWMYWLRYFRFLSCWCAVNPWHLMDLNWGFRGMFHMDIHYVRRELH